MKLEYDDFGQLVKQSRFDTDKPIIETKNKYDDIGRLINISHTGNNKTYADYDITWDNGNRITDFDFTYLNGPAKKNQSNYRYDKTSQLINASYSFMPEESYQYDPNGNRTQATIQDQKISYKTASHNRLISDNNNRYEYDLEGNRTKSTSKDGEIKYYWDNRNRLKKIETPNGTIEYFYDYLNRLVLRKQGETTTTFIHDGWQIVLQFDNDKPTHRYLWGTKQDELICDNDNWTLGDHLNTARDIVKSDGTVTAHLEYNSSGKLLKVVGTKPRFCYSGKMTDEVSDLQWNINRWYDANVGKWISDDPAGFEDNNMNLSCCVKNDFISAIDPLGLWTIKRNGEPLAEATSQCGDTIQKLAEIIGLNKDQLSAWITYSQSEYILTDGKKIFSAQMNATMHLSNNQKFKIPNEFIMAWFGEMDYLGRWWMAWGTNKNGLGQLGFHIRTFNNDIHNTKSVAKNMFLSLVKNSTSSKALHGIYMMGHGSTTSIGSYGTIVSTQGPRWSISYKTIGDQLAFKMGAVVIRACNSNESNAKDTLTDATTAIFSGCTGTYVPINSLNILGLWSNGKQGTNKP